MGFPTRYFLDNISDCGKSYGRSAIFFLGALLEKPVVTADGGESPMRHHAAVPAHTLYHVFTADCPLAKAANSSAIQALATLSAATL